MPNDIARSLDPIGALTRQTTALADAMRLADPMREFNRHTTALADAMRFADPMREFNRHTTALADAMRFANPMREFTRHTTALADAMRLSVLDRFQSIGMATAAAAIGIASPAAFASVWQSPEISAFTGRFVGDPAFKHEFLTHLKAWAFEDLTEDLPSGPAVLSAIEAAIQKAGVAEQRTDSEGIAVRLIKFWADLPADLRQMVYAFIVGLILLVIEYFAVNPALNPQEPALQQKIREQRKLAAYAMNKLGVISASFRISAAEHAPVYADYRRDAPRTGNLEFGQTVQIVQKRRNWCEVIWLAPNGATMGGWVQTRYLRRL